MEPNIDLLRERFTEYLDAMFCKYHFGDVYMNAEDCEEICDEWEFYDDMASIYNIWCANGATRFVLGDDYCDYIIKFQKNSDEIDYSAIECDIYRDAVAAGYADKFIWCEHLMDYKIPGEEGEEIKVYVYKYAQCSYDMISDDSYDYHFRSYCEQEGLDAESDDAREEWYNCDGDYTSTGAMLEYAENFWRMKREDLVAFVNFLSEHHVNDLHCGNWGYDNDMLVLTDYAGFGEFDKRSDIKNIYRCW